ncbi:YcfL family protein [Marinobacter sediminum]|uniref:YcfL family protein n=1 Tax=Marinobacter sediminum TaxID=256323 RepID=UPI001939A15F|nr:YcfL family protein [Marinobacter sediminum]
MIHLMKFLAVAAIGLSVTTGCAYKSADSTELTERTAPVTMNSVVFTDYNLKRTWTGGFFSEGERYRLSVVQHGQRPSATGTTEVYAVLRNHTDYDYQIEARTQFFDQDGVPTDVRPTWQRTTVPANSLSTYRELSATTQPLQYRVEVRELN